jgi:glutaredoxin
MMLRTPLLLISFISLVAQAQVYKWADSDGNINYSDKPPSPKTTQQVETKSFAASDGSHVAFPYELAQAVKKMPVTFYSTSKCAPCDSARTFLKRTGIPFSEKTVTSNSDVEKLNKMNGDTQLPVLMVGQTKLKGYSYTDWYNALTQAGYPKFSMLPPTYQYPAPQPLTPAVTTSEPDKPKTAAPNNNKPASKPALPARDPNGFQF